MEVGASMVQMGWRPARLLVHLLLLSSLCLLKWWWQTLTTRFMCEWVSSTTGTPGSDKAVCVYLKENSYHSSHLIWPHFKWPQFTELSGSKYAVKRPSSPWMRPIRTKYSAVSSQIRSRWAITRAAGNWITEIQNTVTNEECWRCAHVSLI